MANTKSKTTKTTAIKLEENVSIDDARNKQIEKLQQQVDEQKQQIDELLSVLKQASFNNVIANTVDSNDDIKADEEILIVSLMPNKLNLIGDGGVVFLTFDEMYEEQSIDYATLKEIVRTNRQMAKNGRFYILNEKAVNKLRLKNDYKNILTPEQLKTLISQDVSNAINLYQLANNKQKTIIIEIIKQSKFSGKEIDYNLLKKLEELSGIELVDVEDVTKIEK